MEWHVTGLEPKQIPSTKLSLVTRGKIHLGPSKDGPNTLNYGNILGELSEPDSEYKVLILLSRNLSLHTLHPACRVIPSSSSFHRLAPSPSPGLSCPSSVRLAKHLEAPSPSSRRVKIAETPMCVNGTTDAEGSPGSCSIVCSMLQL